MKPMKTVRFIKVGKEILSNLIDVLEEFAQPLHPSLVVDR